MTSGDTPAHMHWESRWNVNRSLCAAVLRRGSAFTATGPMGTIEIEHRDLPFFLDQMRIFLDLLEKEASK
jgi:hypothetical protein